MPGFSSTRTIVIDAPPSAIRPLITDFRAWTQWSPWEGLDPDLKRTYTGEGVGAHYAWSGNNKAGQGSMTMTSISAEQVEGNLVFALMGKLFFDNAIRKDFDRGLAALKAEAERD